MGVATGLRCVPVRPRYDGDGPARTIERCDGPAVRPRYAGDGRSVWCANDRTSDGPMGVATGLRCVPVRPRSSRVTTVMVRPVRRADGRSDGPAVRLVRERSNERRADGRSDGPAVRPGASEVVEGHDGDGPSGATSGWA